MAPGSRRRATLVGAASAAAGKERTMNAADVATVSGPHAGLLDWLAGHRIEYELHEHPLTYTARETARAEGVDPAAFEARVACPIGLPIGGETPGEIAVSIVAEMVRVRRAKDLTAIVEAVGSKKVVQTTHVAGWV